MINENKEWLLGKPRRAESVHHVKFNNYNSNVRIAVVDPGARILFLFAMCRYLSILGILLVNSNYDLT